MNTQPPATEGLRWYRRAWSTAATLTTLCGAVVAVAAAGLPTVVVVCTLVFAVSASTCWPWCVELGHGGWLAVRTGVVVTLAVLASWGLVVVAGPGGTVLPLLVLVLAPAALSRLRRLARAGRGPRVAETWQDVTATDDTDLADEMRALPLPVLCQLWRASGQELGAAGPRRMLALVQQRAACLDEIERRRPDEFRRWLEDDRRRDLSAYLTTAGEPPRREAE
jgi:hypothetical protein